MENIKRKWEYYSLIDYKRLDIDVDKLNLLGDQGWEVVAITKVSNGTALETHQTIFKREIK